MARTRTNYAILIIIIMLINALASLIYVPISQNSFVHTIDQERSPKIEPTLHSDDTLKDPTSVTEDQGEIPTRGQDKQDKVRSFELNYDSNVIKLKQDRSKVGIKFQLQKNLTVVDAKLKITSLPSFDYQTWDDLNVITDHKNDKTSGSPAIALDTTDVLHMVWTDTGEIETNDNDRDIIYAKNRITTWLPFTEVSVDEPEIPSPSSAPDIFIDSSDNIHMVWTDKLNISNNGNDYDIFYRNLKHFGNESSWKGPFIISDETGAGKSTNPKVVVNHSGDVFVVWQDNENNLTNNSDFDILCKVWHEANQTWSNTMIISDDINNGESVDPNVTVDGDNVYVVWSDDGNISDSGNDKDIILRIWNGMTWDAPIVISNHTKDQISTKPTIDARNDVVYIAWEETGDIDNSGSDKDIVIRKLSNSVWSDHMVISDDSNDGESTNPNLLIDSKMNVHLVWSDDGELTPGDFDNDIIYRRLDHITDKWSNYIMISDHPTNGNSIDPKISVNNDERVEIVWVDYGNIDMSDIDPDIINRSSKFIYPRNLKMKVSSDSSNLTFDENHTLLQPGNLKDQIVIDGDWLVDELNRHIYEMSNPLEDHYLIFASETNSSIKIVDLETTLTATPSIPTDLYISNEEIAHVIDHNPVFGWDFFDNDSYDQGGFEIQVASQPGLVDMWSYGPISTNIQNIQYKGNPLLDNHTYYFRVSVKDKLGAWSRWSAYESFTMNALPEIISLTPVSGTADDFIDIEWSGSDGNGDALLYSIEAYYNGDWHKLLSRSRETKYRLDTSNIPAEKSVDLRGKCYDGFEDSEGWYNEGGTIIIIHNHQPWIIIITPPIYNAIANDSYNIQWNSYDADPDDKHMINLYYDTDKDYENKTEIVLDLPDNGSYLWDCSEVLPGQYYICVEISDNKSYNYGYSDGNVTIDHTQDTRPPRVIETEPGANSKNVSVYQEIRVKFSKPMDTSTLISENFFVKDSLERIIDGNLRHTEQEIIFVPKHLDYSHIYSVSVKASVRDISGSFLDGNNDHLLQGSPEDDHTWSFTTIPWGGDVSPPYILSVIPEDLEIDISVRPIITVIFSEDIHWDNKTRSSVFIINTKGNFVDADVYFISSRNELQINFDNDLEFNKKYTILITSELRDLVGHGLDGNKNGISEASPVDDYSWSFSTQKTITPGNGENAENDSTILDTYSICIIITVIILIVMILVIKRQFKRGKFIINDIFVIYNDGRVLAHQSFESRSNLDESAMGGMLTAIQNFVSESFQDHEDEQLKEIKYGGFRILLVHGKNIYLAIICTGDFSARTLLRDMQKLESVIELKFGKALDKWNGDMKKVKAIGELIKF